MLVGSNKGVRVPRYRFSWTNLPPRLLRDLARTLELDESDPAGALRSYYGARPQDDFMKDAWRALIDLWLAKDAESRRSIVEELRALGLGNSNESVRTAAQQLSYLRSCRNSKTLRDVVLAHFVVVLGEASKVAPEAAVPTPAKRAPARVSEPKRPDGKGAGGTDGPAASLSEWIKGVLNGEMQGGEAKPDEDGDFPIRHGSALVFVRPVDESPIGPSVHFFSPIVADLEPTPELFLTLNELNLQLPMAKLAYTQAHQVYLICDLPGVTLGAGEFLGVCKLMCDMADSLDSRFRKSFGGRTMFEDVDDAVEV